MKNSRPRINIVLLAAGNATRFGACKQLALYQRRPLVSWAAQAAARCDHPLTMLAPLGGGAIVDAVREYSKYTIVNENTGSGIGDSIALATRALHRVSDAILFALADQPLVTATHLANLITAWDGAENAIVATAYSETVGPPILFPKAAFDALGQLTGDVGAKALLSDPTFDVTTIRFEPASLDVDTMSDLQALP